MFTLDILPTGETEHGDMTKLEAIKYMRDNNYAKITHCLFASDEYIYMKPDGNIYTEEGYLFEDFSSSYRFDGMRIRTGINWEEGWSLY